MKRTTQNSNLLRILLGALTVVAAGAAFVNYQFYVTAGPDECLRSSAVACNPGPYRMQVVFWVVVFVLGLVGLVITSKTQRPRK